MGNPPMKHDAGTAILEHLACVRAERAARASDAGLAARTSALKSYQHRRFEMSYRDLLEHPRYAAASRFFLQEIYGPSDFTCRDEQFARIVPALLRLFPKSVVVTVEALLELHALSEQLDTRMARCLTVATIDSIAYARAWQICSNAPGREQQIRLILEVGQSLDQLTRNPVLSQGLRLMRGPAHLAGMAALQAFLESGFDAFRHMQGASEFLDEVGRRERELAALLFSTSPDRAGCLSQLP
jgi:hypothetical protein